MQKFGLPEIVVLLFLAVIVAIAILPWRFIYCKAGYSGWWALIEIVPIANFIALIWFASTKWPIESELERLKTTSPNSNLSSQAIWSGPSGFQK